MSGITQKVLRTSRLQLGTVPTASSRALVRRCLSTDANIHTPDAGLPPFPVLGRLNPYPDSNWVSRKSVPSSNTAPKKAVNDGRGEFEMPLGTMFLAPSREAGLADAAKYARALRTHGVAAINLGFQDSDSSFLETLVSLMGCRADSHSETQGALWDIKYKPEGVKSTGSDQNVHSRSHSLGEFNWHTDASFEPELMRWFGFHILHTDKMGGGIFRVLPANSLVNLLSPDAVETLLSTEFDIQVPLEFYKGTPSIRGKLLSREPGTGNLLVRFRRDILPDPPSSDPRANAAVKELMDLLEDPDGVGQTLPNNVFADNSVLFMDNSRFLHSRTNIRDPRRHLRRIRFRGTPNA